MAGNYSGGLEADLALSLCNGGDRQGPSGGRPRANMSIYLHALGLKTSPATAATCRHTKSEGGCDQDQGLKRRHNTHRTWIIINHPIIYRRPSLKRQKRSTNHHLVDWDRVAFLLVCVRALACCCSYFLASRRQQTHHRIMVTPRY
jgi:hypothetical protein